MVTLESRQESFTVFAKEVEPRLRHALTAVFGQERARDATAEALAYGWEHWDRVRVMENPAGYLYRVGRNAHKMRRVHPEFLPVPNPRLPDVEPGLPKAIARLSEKQRTAVLLCYGLGWTRQEVADLLGVSINSVGAHLSRGLDKLRSYLGVMIDG
jgi:RNA polymerase sigma-70 factor (ECF subfamily)